MKALSNSRKKPSSNLSEDIHADRVSEKEEGIREIETKGNTLREKINFFKKWWKNSFFTYKLGLTEFMTILIL